MHTSLKEVAVPLSKTVLLSPSETYLQYFFTHFLLQNGFEGISPYLTDSLSCFIHRSSELHDAVNAIAAFHISQRDPTVLRRHVPAALQAYSRSVQSLQIQIGTESIVRDPSVFWTTLLLGVFEVSSISHNKSWYVKHVNANLT